MYFPDLSPYTLTKKNYGELNVGWLGEGHPFPQGNSPPAFVERLKQFCAFHVHLVRCICPCFLCEPWGFVAQDTSEREKIFKEVHRVEVNGELIHLGSAEIRVLGKERKIYAAPDLIYHYVAAHKYLPPQEFIDAVMTCPPDWCRYACIYPKNTGGILERLFSWGDPKPPVGELMWPEDNY